MRWAGSQVSAGGVGVACSVAMLPQPGVQARAPPSWTGWTVKGGSRGEEGHVNHLRLNVGCSHTHNQTYGESL